MKKNKRNIRALFVIFSVLPALSYGASFSKSVSDSVEGTINSELAVIKGIWKSSTSSSHGNVVAQGDYKVTGIAVADGRENQMKIALQAPGDDRTQDLVLYMPATDYTNVNLSVGQVVTAKPRAYGLAFYQVQAADPFAVVLADTWLENLNTKSISS